MKDKLEYSDLIPESDYEKILLSGVLLLCEFSIN